MVIITIRLYNTTNNNLLFYYYYSFKIILFLSKNASTNYSEFMVFMYTTVVIQSPSDHALCIRIFPIYGAPKGTCMHVK